MTPSLQNLNSKLPATEARRHGVGGRAPKRAATRPSTASVRVGGARSSYRGGYHLSGR